MQNVQNFMKGAKKMVITLSEAKTLNQISVSTYDTLINMLIPIVEDSICNYCNNHFVDSYKSINNILPTVYYEIEGNTIVIARVTYPQTLKLVAASMVKYLMVKQTPGFKS